MRIEPIVPSVKTTREEVRDMANEVAERFAEMEEWVISNKVKYLLSCEGVDVDSTPEELEKLGYRVEVSREYIAGNFAISEPSEKDSIFDRNLVLSVNPEDYKVILLKVVGRS